MSEWGVREISLTDRWLQEIWLGLQEAERHDWGEEVNMIQGLMRIFSVCRWPIIFPRPCVEGVLKAFVSTREEQSVMRLLHFLLPPYLKQVLTGWRNLFAIKAFSANMCSPTCRMEHFLNHFDTQRKRLERGEKTWKVIAWTVRLSHSRVVYALLAMRCTV